ncbi:MAG: hypothetical protein P8N02_16825 [Actinomycetota bacterium]|jgi:hypothetical protein|nr:hypothetical protein [Actinomycetota bacterium]
MANDGDTRKVNEDAFKDPNAMWVPMEKFRSFTLGDRLWVIAGLLILVVVLNLVFGLGGDDTTGG